MYSDLQICMYVYIKSELSNFLYLFKSILAFISPFLALQKRLFVLNCIKLSHLRRYNDSEVSFVK